MSMQASARRWFPLSGERGGEADAGRSMPAEPGTMESPHGTLKREDEASVDGADINCCQSLSVK